MASGRHIARLMRHLSNRQRRALRIVRNFRETREEYPGAIYTTLQAAETFSLTAPDVDVRAVIPAEFRQDAQYYLRQRIHYSHRDPKLNRQRVAWQAGQRKSYPMALPWRWIRAMRTAGEPISGLSSRLHFLKLVLLRGLRNVKHILTLIRLQKASPLNAPDRRRAHIALTEVNWKEAPRQDRKTGSMDMAGWLRQHHPEMSEGHDILIIAPSCPGDYGLPDNIWVTRQVWPVLPRSDYRRWVGRSLWYALRAGFALLIGRWGNLFILDQAVELDYVRRVPDDQLARHYMSNVGNSVIRPLWTYDAERRGSDIHMIYYSVTSIMLTDTVGPLSMWGAGEALTTWPHYFVMSETLAESMKEMRHDGKLNYTLDPFICWRDGNDDVRPKKSADEFRAAIFPGNPWMVSQSAIHGTLGTNIDEPNTLAFFKDVVDACGATDTSAMIKAKPRVSTTTSPRYVKIFNRLINVNHAELVEAETAPLRLIKEVDCVICFPFTTPAVIARALNIPVCLYDPVGQIAARHDSYSDVKIITGVEELTNWLNSLRA